MKACPICKSPYGYSTGNNSYKCPECANEWRPRDLELEKGLVYEFTFEQHKAPLSKKVSEFLEKEKEIEMNAIYDFKLKSIKLIDEGGSNQASEDKIKE